VYSTEFDYYRAQSLADAQKRLASTPGAKLLAGGHSLIPLMKLRLAAPSLVIDVGRIPELRGISKHGNDIRIGALTTHAELASSAELRSSVPTLAEAAALVGDPAVRNRGTIGGNVAHADPASDLPTVLVALDARLVVAGSNGERTIPAAEFFIGIMTTALAEDEIVTAVLVPALARGQGSAYVKFFHPASRYAVIGAAALLTMAAGKCARAQIALGGLLPYARRARSIEQALIGTPANADSIASAAQKVTADLGDDVMGDLYASSEYRAAMAPIYVKRALTAAAARVGMA
jgi:aerobic carbon-monoxide dehydrogenase medium subunit